MIPSIIAIPAIFLLTLIYILVTIFFRPNKHNKVAQKRSPGPLAVPVIGNIHLLGTLPHRKLQSLANKYGPIMLVWLEQVPAIVVSSSEAAKHFLKTPDPAFTNNRPQTQASDYLFYGSKGLVFSNYGSYWFLMKKPSVQHLLSASNQELVGHVRREEIRMIVKSLGNAAKMGEIVDISGKVHGLLEDIVYKIVLGRNKDDQFDLKGLVSEGLRLAGAFNFADIVPWLGAFDLQGFTKCLKEKSRELDQLLEKIIKEYEKAPNTYKDGKHEDFIDILLPLLMHQHKGDEQNHEIIREDIKDTILSMLARAYETSTVTTVWSVKPLNISIFAE